MLGMLRYCNALPFYYAFPEKAFPLYYDTPNRLYALLEQKKVTAALTSSLHDLPTFSPFCIAAHKEVFSVTLYSKVSPLHLQGKVIGITNESTTSFALLRILCLFHWKIDVTFQVMDSLEQRSDFEAFLLIGDEALEKQMIPGYHSFDLATVWYEMTALPFVFALFFAHDEPPFLTMALEQSLSKAMKEKEIMIKKVATEKKLPFSLIKAYYQSLHYILGPEEKRGLDEFRLLARHV